MPKCICGGDAVSASRHGVAAKGENGKADSQGTSSMFDRKCRVGFASIYSKFLSNLQYENERSGDSG